MFFCFKCAENTKKYKREYNWMILRNLYCLIKKKDHETIAAILPRKDIYFSVAAAAEILYHGKLNEKNYVTLKTVIKQAKWFSVRRLVKVLKVPLKYYRFTAICTYFSTSHAHCISEIGSSFTMKRFFFIISLGVHQNRLTHHDIFGMVLHFDYRWLDLAWIDEIKKRLGTLKIWRFFLLNFKNAKKC